MIAPDPQHPLTGPFWQAANNDTLVMCWCSSCDHAVWFPKANCPDCGETTGWRELSGRARLLSWTVVQGPINPSFKTPYIPALVVPDEAPGSRLVTQLVDTGETKLICDMPLQVCFRELETLEGLRYRAPLFSPRR